MSSAKRRQGLKKTEIMECVKKGHFYSSPLFPKKSYWPLPLEGFNGPFTGFCINGDLPDDFCAYICRCNHRGKVRRRLQ